MSFPFITSVMPFFNIDVVLRITYYLDLSSALALSQTCSLIYQLSLSSKSYWIHTSDVYQLRVPLSQIRNDYTPVQVRYMARIFSAYCRNFDGEDFVAFDFSRRKFGSDGPSRIMSDPHSNHWGISSSFVQGRTPESLPWLVMVKGNTLRCDCLDPKYDVGIEWNAQSLIDWFWRCDLTISSVEGVLKEFVTVTITTNNSPENFVDVLSMFNQRIPIRSTKLCIIRISLPSRQDVRACEIVNRTSVFSSTPYHKQSTNTLQVELISCTYLPLGFLNSNCRPTSCGSKVYLVLKNQNSNPSTFSVFIYDWKEHAGVRCRLPKDIAWRKVIGFPSIMLFQDWKGPVYGVNLPELSPLPQFSLLDPDSHTWPCPSEPLSLSEIRFVDHITGEHWDPVDSDMGANILPRTGTIHQASTSAFYLISRLGARLACCLYRCANSPSELEFSRVACGYVAIGDPTPDLVQVNQYLALKTGGTRTLLMSLTNADGSRKNVSFSVIDFDVDCEYDGSQGVKRIAGIKRELRVPSRMRSLLGNVRAAEVLDRGEVGEVFFDGFRGTIGLVTRDYKEALLLKCTRD